MTWRIIVSDSRKQSDKTEDVQKNKRNLLSQSVQKPYSKEVENQVLHL